jgi:hypothetical protein
MASEFDAPLPEHKTSKLNSSLLYEEKRLLGGVLMGTAAIQTIIVLDSLPNLEADAAISAVVLGVLGSCALISAKRQKVE